MTEPDWEAYESNLYNLFSQRFPEHPFGIRSVTSGSSPTQPSVTPEETTPAEERTESTAELINNKWNHGRDKFTLFRDNVRVVPVGPDIGENLVPKRFRQYYLCSTTFEGQTAICVPETDNLLRSKLTEGAQVLRRYYGVYIAAVLEMLAENYFLDRGQILPENTQAGVLNLEWKSKAGGDLFFPNLAKDLIRAIYGCLPGNESGTDWVSTERTGSQKLYRGSYVDFLLYPQSDTRSSAVQLDGVRYTQTYNILPIAIEIKVLNADNNSMKKHQQLAIQNVGSVSGSEIFTGSTTDNYVPACFCLSHSSDGENACTLTTLALKASPHVIIEFDGTTSRPVPFVDPTSLKTLDENKERVTLKLTNGKVTLDGTEVTEVGTKVLVEG